MTADERNLIPAEEATPTDPVQLDPLPVLPQANRPGDPDLLRELRLFHLSLSPTPDDGAPMRPLPAPPRVSPAEEDPAGTDRSTPIRMLLDAVGSEHVPARRRFLEERGAAGRILRGILDTERAKKPEGRSEETVKEALGGVGSRFVNPGVLAGLMGQPRGSVPMDPEREAMVREALARLDTEVADEDTDPILVHDGCLDDLSADGLAGWQVVRADDACTAAVKAFDVDAATLATHLRDVRLAKLEERGDYDPSRHDPWLSQFGWQSFSPEERALLRPVVAVLSREHIAENGMQSLSSLLLSGRPLQIVVLVEPARLPDADSDSQFGNRFEPGYLGISHRDVLVWQSTPSHPAHLREGFRRGLHSDRTALHVVGLPAQGANDLDLLEAAVSSRAHPLFSYDPQLGGTWARRLSFGENPAPTEDWTTLHLAVMTETGNKEIRMKLATTFADHALRLEANRGHYRAVHESVMLEELVPLDEYFALPDDQAPAKVPFVWGMGADGRMVRLVLSRVLTLAARDRLDFWRTLEELAGVRNEYVETARSEVRAAMEMKSRQERDTLLAQHSDEVERIRQEATEAAVNRLAATLLGEDPGVVTAPAPAPAPATAPPQAGTPPPAAPPTAEAAPAPAQAEPPVEATATEPAAAEPMEEMDPYIDTPLCTTCNDCTELNPLMFAYDDDKKAYIKDATAGTYKDLVVAAEKCTAKIIHPGTPLNPDEPNLEDLMRRAAPFNV